RRRLRRWLGGAPPRARAAGPRALPRLRRAPRADRRRLRVALHAPLVRRAGRRPRVDRGVLERPSARRLRRPAVPGLPRFLPRRAHVAHRRLRRAAGEPAGGWLAMSGGPLRGRDLGGDVTFEADAVVVGTGAGGSVSVRELARAGLNVIALEEGAWSMP